LIVGEACAQNPGATPTTALKAFFIAKFYSRHWNINIRAICLNSIISLMEKIACISYRICRQFKNIQGLGFIIIQNKMQIRSKLTIWWF
jgi:hypothetical protein